MRSILFLSKMSANVAGQILTPDQESDAEVRREDQDNINLFGRLNARLHEVRDERKSLKVRWFFRVVENGKP